MNQDHHSLSRLHRWLDSVATAGPAGAVIHVSAGQTAREVAQGIAHRLADKALIVDLSSVVSRYMGETEKNLDAVFEQAQDLGVLLLFDEADALMGKRTEVKDAHDRYSNQEISYLLQRIQEYEGLAILVSNCRELVEAVERAGLRCWRFGDGEE